MTRDELDLVRINDLRGVRIALASPQDVLDWSHGEVTRPDTINYRTHRPEKGGLFCERIFGPEKDWECSCGKYRGLKFKGMTCDRCGVTVAHSRVRRKRMGHIELAAPVVHIWFFKGVPSVLGQLLDLKRAALEQLVYYRAHVVLDPGPTGLKPGQMLTDDELRHYREQHGDDFRAETGAAAIEALLARLDLAELAGKLRRRLDELAQSERRTEEERKKLVRRLSVVEALLHSPNRPEWMVPRRIPVIPPDLRPVVLLESGNYASSDLNDLYRRVIQRNIRLKKLLDLRAPEIILRNERRLLQQAVDALFDNSRTASPVQGASRRPLRSLADLLKGKQGRFRENLLGKRVDYSGRSVIVVDPALKLHQCGLPKVMALELFQPFIVRRLREQDPTLTVHRARRLIQARGERIWDALEEVMKGHPVLLNRAPTLHRMGIQAFEPVLVEGNAIRLHPLVCRAFNADFDGDQMAVHLPLSVEAIAEARERMMAPGNIFSPANGQPIIAPSKDMVLGCYYLTAGPGRSGEPSRTASSAARLAAPTQTPARVFAGVAEVIRAHAEGRARLHDVIAVRLPGGREVIHEGGTLPAEKVANRRVVTTVGRVLFNDVLPAGMAFYDLPLTVRNLSRLVADCQSALGLEATVALLERIKQVGFQEATRSGVSFAVDDLCSPADKEALLARAQHKADEIVRRHDEGLISDEDRYDKLIELWAETTDDVAEQLMAELAADRRADQPINPLYAMAASGARGSQAQVGQLGGMRGLMRRPSGEVLETPIKASFREGLSSLEYFNSTHGARKGLVDTAMKTADSGYLTRKLADVALPVVVTEPDCGTHEGVRKTVIRAGRTVERGLGEAVRGRVSCQAIRHPVTGVAIVAAGEMVSIGQAKALDELGLEELLVRSPLRCKAARGVCQRCYGMDRSTGRLVELGTAVGIIAAQSIGEPATQLIMRNFQAGGQARKDDVILGLPRVIRLFEAHRSKRPAVLAEVAGAVRPGGAEERRRGRQVVFVQPVDEQGRPRGKEVAHVVPAGRRLIRQAGECVAVGEPLTSGPIDAHEMLRVLGPLAVRTFLVDEIQKVYRGQGIDLDDKHVEVIVARMLARVKVVDAGDTKFLPGQVVERRVVEEANARLTAKQRPARVQALLLGVSRAAVQADSFLSAASFQETTRVLTQAALAGQVDELRGLKENVLLGHLVPVGTGFRPAVEPRGLA
jgi:DNA-directed RNA polymerase subunit beta'